MNENTKHLEKISKNAENEMKGLEWIANLNPTSKKSALEAHYGIEEAKRMANEFGGYRSVFSSLKEVYAHAVAEHHLAMLAMCGQIETHFDDLFWKISEWEEMVRDFMRTDLKHLTA